MRVYIYFYKYICTTLYSIKPRLTNDSCRKFQIGNKVPPIKGMRRCGVQDTYTRPYKVIDRLNPKDYLLYLSIKLNPLELLNNQTHWIH